jgi:hypothetical protein
MQLDFEVNRHVTCDRGNSIRSESLGGNEGTGQIEETVEETATQRGKARVTTSSERDRSDRSPSDGDGGRTRDGGHCDP